MTFPPPQKIALENSPLKSRTRTKRAEKKGRILLTETKRNETKRNETKEPQPKNFQNYSNGLQKGNRLVVKQYFSSPPAPI